MVGRKKLRSCVVMFGNFCKRSGKPLLTVGYEAEA